MPLRQRTAEHREILREDKYEAAIHRAGAGNYSVTGDVLLVHAEVDAVMLDIHVQLLKAAFIEQHIEAFARGEAAFGVLSRDAPFAAAHMGSRALLLQLLDDRHFRHAQFSSGYPVQIRNAAPFTVQRKVQM